MIKPKKGQIYGCYFDNSLNKIIDVTGAESEHDMSVLYNKKTRQHDTYKTVNTSKELKVF